MTGSVPRLFFFLDSYLRSHIQDDDWADDEVPEGSSSRANEMTFLSDLISGPGGLPFDNDDLLEAADDEDLKSDPVSQMDMKVREGFYSY